MSEKYRCRRCGREVEIELTTCPECGTVLERVITEKGGDSFDAFVSELVRTHGEIRAQMSQIEKAVERGDHPAALTTLRALGESLDRHIVDEEARVLKVLIDVHGREGASDAIKTMQQHRRVHQLVKDLADSLSTAPKAAPERRSELDRVLREHLEAEERRIFPWAVEADRKRRRAG